MPSTPGQKLSCILLRWNQCVLLLRDVLWERREDKKVWLIHKLWTEPGCWKWLIQGWESSGWSRDKRPGRMTDAEGWLCMARPDLCSFFLFVLSVHLQYLSAPKYLWDMNPQQATAQLSASLIWAWTGPVGTHALVKHICSSMLLNTYLYTVRAHKSNSSIILSPEPTQRQQHYLVWWLSKCSL